MKAIHKLMVRMNNQWVETDVEKLAYLAGEKVGTMENTLSKMYEGQTGTTSNGYQYQLQAVEFVQTDLEAKLAKQKEDARNRFRELMRSKGTEEALQKLEMKEQEWAREAELQKAQNAEKEIVQNVFHEQVTGKAKDEHLQDKSHLKKEIDRLRSEIARLKGIDAEEENAEEENAEEANDENLTMQEIENLQQARFELSQKDLQNKVDAILNDVLREYGILPEGESE